MFFTNIPLHCLFFNHFTSYVDSMNPHLYFQGIKPSTTTFRSSTPILCLVAIQPSTDAPPVNISISTPISSNLSYKRKKTTPKSTLESGPYTLVKTLFFGCFALCPFTNPYIMLHTFCKLCIIFA